MAPEWLALMERAKCRRQAAAAAAAAAALVSEGLEVLGALAASAAKEDPATWAAPKAVVRLEQPIPIHRQPEKAALAAQPTAVVLRDQPQRYLQRSL